MTAIYRILIIGGIAVQASSLGGQPALAIWGLTSLVLGLAMRSERWRSEAKRCQARIDRVDQMIEQGTYQIECPEHGAGDERCSPRAVLVRDLLHALDVNPETKEQK